MDFHDLAERQGQILSRRQLFDAGITRGQLRAHLAARRWRACGRHAVALHTGPLTQEARWWRAVIEAGPRSMLDGVSALQAAGAKGLDDATIRVSVPRGARTPRVAGVTVRQTRRLARSDLAGPGLPRVRPAIAAVRAALWARSDRQATFLLTLVVQQRLCRPEDVARSVLDVRRHARRALLMSVAADLVDGVRAVGELDFARLCREQGIPEPERQRVRRTADGRIYLDAEWPQFGVAVEIDGIHHLHGPVVVHDALRQNEVTLDATVVLRIPNLGLRVAPREFLGQVRRALIAGGWHEAA